MICALIGVVALVTASPSPSTLVTPPPGSASDVLNAADLDAARGGEEHTVTVSTQALTGVSGGNSVNANNVTTGGVMIGSGAFSGFNGLGNFVVNTGNNNVVQGALSVSISMPSTH